LPIAATTELGSAKNSKPGASNPASHRTAAANSPYAYDKAPYRQRHKVESLFTKLKGWRRIATRCDRYAHTFFSAICIAAAVIF
jgi:transposase